MLIDTSGLREYYLEGVITMSRGIYSTMTSVNITTTKNTVTVNEGDATVVTVATQGSQGPSFLILRWMILVK